MMKGYLFLIIAIILETIGTSLLKASDQFTKLFPSLGAIIAELGQGQVLCWLCLSVFVFLNRFRILRQYWERYLLFPE